MKIEEFRINLEFSVDEMNMVFNFLETIPYGQVAGLYENIKKQVDAQLVPMDSFDGPKNNVIAENGHTSNIDYPV
jgi:hypothetical protein